ncbi:aldose epimerase [Oscillatoria sp. FACHB-1407]|uniref:aldose epimerase family protein n=1 Tax=Oscillatoria sp. FACHB-1407 TaxID=2692847 RepID=UPI00168288E6|nr:aldose epimerase [Oscillatoria sp. FACHB-1407]MBD2461833.1 aldose epimerase [Oscillatoria sp. FACHB-1407]
MFAIATQQEQYKTYVLSDETAQAQVEVVPERGGIVTRWKLQEHDILYLDAARFTNPELTVRGGIPILFPICGNLPDNTYTHNGQTYTLKQHGFARDLPWEVVEQGTQDSAHLSLQLTSNEQTRAVYPFDFLVNFTYKLQGNSLEIHQRFTNRSSEPMPFSTGLHPYFEVTDKSQLTLDIPGTEFYNQRSQSVDAYSGKFDFEQDEIDAAFRNVTRQSASATDLSRKLHLTVEYDSVYSTVVFWTVKGKDFYCLEPWTAPRNALNTGEHLTHLEPGATLEAIVKLSVTVL